MNSDLLPIMNELKKTAQKKPANNQRSRNPRRSQAVSKKVTEKRKSSTQDEVALREGNITTDSF